MTWEFNPDIAVKSWQNSNSRYCIFIDGNNLYHGSKKKLNLKFEENELKNLIDYFCPTYKSRDVFYYNVLPVPHRDGYSQHRSRKDLFDRFKNAIPNLQVVLGYLQKHLNGSTLVVHEKKVDTQICVDMLRLAVDKKFDCAILISGDMDMVPAVKEIKKRCSKKKIYNVAINEMASGELYRLCDKYILIDENMAKNKFGFKSI